MVRNDFIFTLGLLLLFSVNKEKEYYLSEHQLFRILPNKYSRFVEDLYSLKIRNPINGIHIDELDNKDDDFELLCKFNLGVKAQLELLKEDVLNGHDKELTKLNRELQHLKIQYDFDWQPY